MALVCLEKNNINDIYVGNNIKPAKIFKKFANDLADQGLSFCKCKVIV